MNSLVLASLKHFRGLHALVIAGIAVAVAVLAGALLVGSSVRASLRDLALARLGATELVLSSTGFFRAALADDLRRLPWPIWRRSNGSPGVDEPRAGRGARRRAG